MKGVAVPLQSGFSLGTPNEGTRETKRSMPCAAVQVVLLLDGERERSGRSCRIAYVPEV